MIGGIRRENRKGPNDDWEAAQGGHPRQEGGEGTAKKRTRPKPRQYTIADLERARDRVAAAERRIDNDRTNNANRGRAGLERAQLELSVIESQLRLRGLLGSARPVLAAFPHTVPTSGTDNQAWQPDVC